MTIRLDENDHVVCFWLADSLEDDNFLMLLRLRDGRYVVDYRFRYKRDDVAFDSKDEKHFFQATFNDPDVTEAKVVETCQEMFLVICAGYPLRNVCQRIDGDIKSS